MVLKAGLVIGLVAIAGFTGWAAIAILLKPGLKARREYGGLTHIPVTGEVLDSGSRTSAKSGDTDHWATVRYRTASGADIVTTLETSVPRAVGDKVTVHYDPARPDRARTGSIDTSGPTMIGLGLFLLGVDAYFVLGSVFSWLPAIFANL